jgi:ABC-type transport system involved in cytochrome bd biosynthesis fused ATPase/permease subunit
MESVFILVVAGLTSAGAYILGAARLGFSTTGLRLALGKACEGVGLTLLFSVVNLAVAVLVILVMRSLSGRFVSLYVASDITFLMLSGLQALTFQAWRENSPPHRTSEPLDGDLLGREP